MLRPKPKKAPPTKVEAKVDEVMHTIDQHLDKIRAFNGKRSERVRRKITAKRTRMAVTAYSLEDSDDGEQQDGASGPADS